MKKNKTGKPRPEPEEIRAKQDAAYSEDEFESALKRSTEKLGDSSEPDRELPRKLGDRRSSD